MGSLIDIFSKLKNEMTIAELIDLLEERVFGFLIFLFALPNAIPIPVSIPGLSLIFGIPLFVMSFQLMYLNEPSLPKFLTSKKIPAGFLIKAFEKLTPIINWVGKFSGNKFEHMGLWAVPVSIGMMSSSILLCLPIPGMNLIPSIGLLICGLGLIEKDKNFMIIGSICNYSILFVIFTVLTGGVSLFW